MDRAGGVERAALRARGRAARAALDDVHRARATAAIVASLVDLPEVRSARRVVLTRAVGDELDLRAFERRLVASGTTVALPVVRGRSLVVVDVTEQTLVEPGWRGVPEPVGTPVVDPVDVVVVPALAVDRRGARLGYGGGHFDRLLAEAADGATAVGALFACQLVERIPTEPHDVAMDVVVTEDGVLRPDPRDG